MNELVRRIAFEIQDDSMSRVKAQRIVATVLAALDDGDQIGKALIVRSVAPHPAAAGIDRYEFDPGHLTGRPI